MSTKYTQLIEAERYHIYIIKKQGYSCMPSPGALYV